ncbi:MAG: type II toxin-antitoxin system HicB family antitoxin [Planctomycetaceae bacterium]|nr:type II toxin-antitoxin system HicB family antitoxin [Planctomycetaceae bacterium]
MKLAARIMRQSDGTYRAWCPALPGCRACATTRREALERVRLAAKGYLENIEEILPRELARQYFSQHRVRAGAGLIKPAARETAEFSWST